MYEVTTPITEGILDQEVELHVVIGHHAVIGSPKRVFILNNPLQSHILTGRQHRVALQALLGYLKGKKFHLLYQASMHGWSPSDFHRRCDGKGPTVTLVKTSGNGAVFGGYTSESWESTHRQYKTDPLAFLFSLINMEGLGPTKLPLIPGAENSAIYCNPNP